MSPYHCRKATRCQGTTVEHANDAEAPESGRQATDEGFHARLLIALRERALPDAEVERRLARAMAKDKPNKGYLTRLITERRSPTLRFALALARALEVRPSWLLVGDGDMEDVANARRKNSCVAY